MCEKGAEKGVGEGENTKGKKSPLPIPFPIRRPPFRRLQVGDMRLLS